MLLKQQYLQILKLYELKLVRVEETRGRPLELFFTSTSTELTRGSALFERLEMELCGIFADCGMLSIHVEIEKPEPVLNEYDAIPLPDEPPEGDEAFMVPDFDEIPVYEEHVQEAEPKREALPELNSDKTVSDTSRPEKREESDEKTVETSPKTEKTGSPKENALPDWQQKKMQQYMQMIRETTERLQKEPPKADETTEIKHTPGMVVCGKAVGEASTPMSELDMLSEAQISGVVVTGEVFRVEKVDISDKTVLFKFDITDKTNSISCKKFVNKNKDKLEEKIEKLLVPGNRFTFRGKILFDTYERQKLMDVMDIVCAENIRYQDNAEKKRVELHLHTQYSAMDAVSKVSKVMKRAHDYGHQAIGITDHGVLQAYPEVQGLAKKYDIKVLYGVEAYLVDGTRPIVTPGKTGMQELLDGEFVFFDLETTGLYAKRDQIIEIAAVRIRDGRIIDSFERLIDPHRPLSQKISKLTGLTDDDLAGQMEEADALREFYAFADGHVLAAHNASFDTSFLTDRLKKEGKAGLENTVIDSLPLAQMLLPEFRSYKLKRLCSHFKIKNEHAHRALDDSVASAKVLVELFKMAKKKGIDKVCDLEKLEDEELIAKKQARPWHIILYAKNQDGLRDLYEMVSIAHLKYFHKKPRMTRKLISQFRKNLIIGSACIAGELYQAILDDKDPEEIERIAEFYDYLEVQPLGNNAFMTRDDKNPCTYDDLRRHNEQIIALGKKLGKPVCATGDVHFVDPEDQQFRAVLTAQMHSDFEEQPPLYYRNTEAMLKEFNYLPDETAYEVVVANPNKIADQIEFVKPIPDETYPPVIEGAEDDIRNMCESKAHEIYGETLPKIVQERMDRELNSIIGNGYAVLYLIAQKLVANSESAGYLVGSRGSVGSSFAAMLSGITEVNSLPPHYVCPNCHYSEFHEGLGIVGPDLEDKNCPHCGTLMKKDGYDIPFETFLGFEGDKEPDIDLNFSGDNQADAHAYTEVLFGKGKTFRAGTISTLAEKTAFGYVKNYFQERGIIPTNAEVERLKEGCTGVKKTTGQHPGGIMVVPRDQEIYKFTPVQHPADDTSSDTITTHFDYHSISGRLLKLDILGHDDPTMLRILYENTGVNPRSIPLDDKEVLSLFQGVEALHFVEDCDLDLGTAGVPEFGTSFTKQMVRDAKPKTLADLIRLSGLSHGTDVWTNNAQTLVNSGKVTIDQVISTRDDIMLGLIEMGLPPKRSFMIMEKVRKGKGLTPEDESLMRENKVPDWYIDSCKKIKYMFPKAHAAAYVIMAYRIAWYKIHYPVQYYAAYFGIRAKEFNLNVISSGLDAVREEIKRLNNKARTEKLSPKEEQSQVSLELALEMYCRGYSCGKIDILNSDSRFFIPSHDTIIPPFTAVSGLGMSNAINIVEQRKIRPFISQDEFQERCKVNNTTMNALRENGCLKDLPQSNQISFFSL